MLQAYYDCRKRKRRTASAVVYEMDYEARLIALRDRINTRQYAPGKSICFVVTRPRYREVFAASFEDRIVHHYIALRLEPLFEGQLYGVKMLERDLRTVSQNYTRDCWVMKLDLKGFFMSIDRKMLAGLIDAFIVQHYDGPDKEDLRYACQVVILHSPEKNCERHSPARFWDFLPPHKSFFTNTPGKGVAIGNLFAQLFANFLLNVLDWYLEEIGIPFHGRYVDDFYSIHTDKAVLLAAVPKIRQKLAEYGLALNEKKFYLQHYTKGVEFTGMIVKPGRSYICNRVLTNFIVAVRRLNAAKDLRQVRHCICSINSYLGLLRQCNEYGKRVEIIGMIQPQAWPYIYVKGHYEVVCLRNQYKQKTITLKRIRDGDYG